MGKKRRAIAARQVAVPRGTSTLDQDRRRAVAAVRTRLLALALRSDLQETSNAGRMRSILEGLSWRDPAQVVIWPEHPVVAGSLRAERGPGVALQLSEGTCRYRIERRDDIDATRLQHHEAYHRASGEFRQPLDLHKFVGRERLLRQAEITERVNEAGLDQLGGSSGDT